MTDIKKSRFTKQQIIGFLKQAEAGLAVKEVSHGMTARTSAHALHGRQVAKRGQEGPRGTKRGRGDRSPFNGKSRSSSPLNTSPTALRLSTQPLARTGSNGRSTAMGDLFPLQGVILEDFGGAGRSAIEKKISAAIGKMGEAGDQGGHAAALRFFKNLQREDFLFPQNGNLNMGAFRRLEQDYANALKVEGTEVHFKHELLNWDSNRPKAIKVDTVIKRDGADYTTIRQTFKNEPNQAYKSVINQFGYLR